MYISIHAFIRIDRVKETFEFVYDDLFPVFKRSEKYYRIKSKVKIWTFLYRLKPVYLLMTYGSIPDDELLDKSIYKSIYTWNVTANQLLNYQPKINNQVCLTIMSRKKIIRSSKHEIFLRGYKDLLDTSVILFHTYLIFTLIVFCIYHV